MQIIEYFGFSNAQFIDLSSWIKSRTAHSTNSRCDIFILVTCLLLAFPDHTNPKILNILDQYHSYLIKYIV